MSGILEWYGQRERDRQAGGPASGEDRHELRTAQPATGAPPSIPNTAGQAQQPEARQADPRTPQAAPQAQQRPPAGGLAEWLQEGPRREAQHLGTVLRLAREKNPDTAAEVERLRGRTGLPGELIERNLETVRKHAETDDFDAYQFRQEFPRLAGLMQDPDNAALAHDDLEALQLMERTLKLDRERVRRQQGMGFRVWDAIRGEPQEDPGVADYARATPSMVAQGVVGSFGTMTQGAGLIGQQAGQVEADRRVDDALRRVMTTREQMDEALAGTNDDFREQVEANYQQLIEQREQELFDEVAGWATREPSQVAEFLRSRGLAMSEFAQRIGPPEGLGGIYSDVATGVGSILSYLGPGMLTSLLTRGGAGMAAGLAVSGSMAGPSGVTDQYQRAIAGGLSEEEAVATSMQGFPAGLIQVAPLASIIKPLPAEIQGRAIGQLYGILRTAASEFLAENAGAVLQNLVEQSYNEERGTWDDTPYQGIVAGGSAATVQAAVLALTRGRGMNAPSRPPGTVQESARVAQAEEDAETFEALGEAARESKLRERSPEKFREIIGQLQDGEGLDAIHVPVDRWNELFQSSGQDPAAMAAQVTGSDAAYQEAMATGGDLVLPLAEYAATIAPTDLHQQLAEDVRFRPGDMTRREAREWTEGARQDVERDIGEIASQQERSAVFEDVFGQLLAAGRDRSTATQEARVTEAVFRTLGQRLGMEAGELFNRYNVRITRPLPEVLQTPGGDFDAQVDPLLDRLRAGDVPSQTDALGPSLLDFLRERGLRDDGGELAARDVDAGRRAFQRALVRDDGLTLDDAAQAAAEAGYLRGIDRDSVTQNELLEAIEREMREGPVFSDLNANEQLDNLRRTLEELGDYLQQSGIDLNALDNAAVRAMLAGEQAPQAEAGEDVTTLDQEGRRPRGRISFPQSRRFFSIELLEGADLSTFLHESGHLYLEILRDLAQSDDAPQQIRDDFQRVLDWFGVEDADSIGTDQHEQWARGFEAYLYEGNAPSAQLRGVFARFRAWLVAVYRSIRRLDVELTDEVRGVMDRLLASDEEISAARGEADYRPLFEDAEAAGMTAEEYARYREAAEQARASAEEQVTGEVMREFRREREAWWKEAREQVREEVAAEVNQRREYVALSVLQRGTLPDGSALPEGVQPFKISRQSLVDAGFGESLHRLPRPYVYTRKAGGVSVDAAAEALGYRSGAELVEAMTNARPRRALIEGETDARMRERYGDMLNDGSLADVALDAVHNDHQAEVMQRELRALGNRARRPTTPLASLRDAARRIIGEKAVRDVKPGLYRQAEQKAAREAFSAVAEGDYQRATESKQRQLLNHELYREAQRARETSEQAYREARRFATRTRQQRLGRAGQDYREQVNAILERYEFRRVTRRTQERRESLADFLNGILPDDGLNNTAMTDEQLADRAMELASDGERFTITPEMVNEARRVNWQQLSVEELSGVRDMLRLIWRQATLKDELLKNQQFRSLEEARDALIATVTENTRRDIDPGINTPVPSERITDGLGNYFAWHRKLSSIVRQMDGSEDGGTAWQLIMRPLNEASDAETTRIRQEGEALRDLFRKHYSAAELRQMTPQVKSKRTFYQEVGQALSKFEVVSLALNWGNEVNRQRVLDGFGWADQQVVSLFNRAMTEKDWRFVQEVWDYLDGFWPEIAGLNERLYGIPPERVEPTTVATPYGEFRGGYFPIRYNDRTSTRARELNVQSRARAGAGSARVGNRIQAGFTHSRLNRVERPILLDPLRVIQDHVSEVVHEITHTEPVLDVARVLKDRQVSEVLERRLGRHLYRQMLDRLAEIKFGPERARSAFDKAMLYLRAGTTVARLGMNVGTVLLQPFGVSNSIARVAQRAGYSALLSGYSEYLSNPVRATRFAMQKSEMIRTRTITQNRELNEIRNTIERRGTRRKVAELSLYPMAGFQLITVDVPTWLTVYRKAVATGETESTATALADQAVLDAQGGGAIKDLAGVQTGGALQKALSMFMSYMVTTWNLGVESYHRTDFRSPAEVGRFAADMVLLFIVPALSGLLLNGLRNGWDEDEELEVAYLKEQVGFMMGMFLGVREFSGVATGFSYSGPAGLGIVDEVQGFASQVNQGELDQALFNATADTLGIALHLPSGQIKRTADGVWSIYEGNPDNVGQAAKFLLFGDRDN